MALPEIVIEPNKTPGQFWRELWSYRELFYCLAERDILVRYKQTVIGVAWSVLRPLLTIAVFTLVFGKLARLPSGNIPYPIFVFAAMLPWQFFANSFSGAAESVVQQASMVSKIYFPRIIIPTTAIVVNLVDLLIAFALFVVLMLMYGVHPNGNLCFLPLLFVPLAMFSLGLGYWLSALNVRYRDFRFLIPFITQMGLYLSPVGFSSDIVPEKWRLLYALNPMVGVIDGFRWALLGDGVPMYWEGFCLSMLVAVILFVFGTRFFLKTERGFVDVI